MGVPTIVVRCNSNTGMIAIQVSTGVRGLRTEYQPSLVLRNIPYEYLISYILYLISYISEIPYLIIKAKSQLKLTAKDYKSN